MAYSISKARTLVSPLLSDPSYAATQDTHEVNLSLYQSLILNKRYELVEEAKNNAIAAEAATELAAHMIKSQTQIPDSDQASPLELAARMQQEEDTPSSLRTVLKIAKFVAKRLTKYVMRPILRFAINTMKTLARFAVRVVVTWIIQPLLALIGGLIVANPITALAAGSLLAAGGGYYIYNKLLKRKDVKDKISDVPDVQVKRPVQEVESIGAQAPAQSMLVREPATEIAQPVFRTYTAQNPIELLQPQIAPQSVGKFSGFGKDVDTYIKEASAMFPIIPESVMRGFVKMEGGWSGAMSPTGAIGTGQFIVSTWNELVNKHGGAALGMKLVTGVYSQNGKPRIQNNPLGGNFRTPDDPRFDKRANTLATGLLASLNAKLLIANDLPVTGENLYMLHNIGPGIISVMKGGSASSKTLLAMQQNGMRANQSAAEFLQMQKGKFNSHYASANKETSVTSPAVSAPTSIVANKAQAAVPMQSAVTSQTGSQSAPSVKDKPVDIVKLKNGKLLGVK